MTQRALALPTRRPAVGQRARASSSRESVAAYVFLLPWLIGFFVLTLGPLLASLYFSFTDFDLLTMTTRVTVCTGSAAFTAATSPAAQQPPAAKKQKRKPHKKPKRPRQGGGHGSSHAS